MLYNLSNKRFKHFWFALMYVAFLLVGIIYSCTLFTHSNPKTKTWQDVANYDFELLNRTFADGILTNTYGISTPEQLAGVFNNKFPGIGGGTIIKPPDLGDIGDIIDKPPIIVGPGAGGIEIGGSGDTSIVDLDDIQKVDNVYTLLNDIDLTEKNYTWEILDTFSGKFNGNYHTIKGLTIKESVESVGMVGELSSGGEITNLYLDNITIVNETSSSKTTYTGAIAGKNYGKIQNVSIISGSVEGNSYNKSNYARYIGGLVGYNYSSGNIFNCSNNATVKYGRYIGGIAGRSAGTITNCFNYNTISYGNSGDPYIYNGGITGYNSGSLSLCYNNGTINASMTASSNCYAGGIAGYSSKQIDQCANEGGVSAGSSSSASSNAATNYAGGIVGYASASISNCYNLGSVTANAKIVTTYNTTYVNYDNESETQLREFKDNEWYFGVYNQWRINRYYYIKGNANNDKKDIERTIKTESAYAGGIVGNVSSSSYKVSNCYSTGSVSGGKVQYSDVYAFNLYYNQEFWTVMPAVTTYYENTSSVYYITLTYDYTFYYNPIIGAVNDISSSSVLSSTYGLNSYNKSSTISYSYNKYNYHLTDFNLMGTGILIDVLVSLYANDKTEVTSDNGSGTIYGSGTVSLDSSLFSVENIKNVKFYASLDTSDNELTVQAKFTNNGNSETKTLTNSSYVSTKQISASGYTKKTTTSLKSVNLGDKWSQNDTINNGYPYLNGLYW